ncbi:MAG: response regulator [Planctomycetota bacterium JB042]
MVTLERPLLRVLVVEDNQADADLTLEWLLGFSEYDMSVEHALTLRDALETMSCWRVDVVFLDLNLPDSQGVSTLRTIRARSEDVAIVVLSGMESNELRNLARRLGAMDFVNKNESSRHLVERTMQHALDRFRARGRARQMERLVSQNPDGVLVVDAKGAVQFVNAAALDLFGRRREELLGESLGFSVAEGRAAEVEILRGSERRLCEMRVTGVEWQDAPAYLATLRDVTDQRRLADLLRQQQRIEAVGTLAGGVAHDFNNLMAVVLGYCESLAFSEGLSPSDAEAVVGIQQAAESAAGLSRRLLAFGRRSTMEPVPTDLNVVVSELERMLRRLVGSGIELRLGMEPSLPSVLVDPAQLEQVVLNLVVNARDAMASGGRLSIETRSARVEARDDAEVRPGVEPGAYVVLSVADTGEGMSEEVRGRVFEPFFTTKGEGKGTGLGLAVVHGIVDQHRGHVVVASELSQGTTFDVYLPAIERTAESHPRSEPYRLPHGTETVLLAEDEPEVRGMARLVLESCGYRVLEAGDGQEALERAREHGEPIDLLLSDVVMPRKSGPDLAREIAEDHPDVRTIFISGYGDDVLARLGVIGGKAAFLRKPFTAERLARAVRDRLAAAAGGES